MIEEESEKLKVESRSSVSNLLPSACLHKKDLHKKEGWVHKTEQMKRRRDQLRRGVEAVLGVRREMKRWGVEGGLVWGG